MMRDWLRAFHVKMLHIGAMQSEGMIWRGLLLVLMSPVTIPMFLWATWSSRDDTSMFVKLGLLGLANIVGAICAVIAWDGYRRRDELIDELPTPMAPGKQYLVLLAFVLLLLLLAFG